MRKLDVLCIGNAVADTGVRPVSALPARGKLELVESIGLTAGGCAVNSAIAGARLGLKTGAGIPLGRDQYGDFLERRLEEEGVDTAGVVRFAGVQTSSTAVMISRDGERSFLHVIGASGALKEHDIPDRLLKRFRALHLSGFFLMTRLDGAPSARLLKRASRLGLTTSFDTCWDPRGRWHLARMCLPFVDYYLPSLEEACGTFGSRDPLKVAEHAFRAGVRRAVVLKMGPRGCIGLESGGKPVRVPAFRVRAVDATGAGDSFDAGFLAGIMRGWPFEKALRLGNATGALSVAGMGGQGNIRSMKQAMRMAGGNGRL